MSPQSKKSSGLHAPGVRRLLAPPMSESAPPPPQPHGEVVIRTIAMPADANANGDIFGGWLMSQMDLGGAILARGTAHCRVTTVAVDGMSFLRPVNVGDVVTCYAQLLGIGRTSMKIRVEAWVQRYADTTLHHVTEGSFTYVAIDDAGKPQPVRRG
jgi:acyl-CoA thioesterase YciA